MLFKSFFMTYSMTRVNHDNRCRVSDKSEAKLRDKHFFVTRYSMIRVNDQVNFRASKKPEQKLFEQY